MLGRSTSGDLLVAVSVQVSICVRYESRKAESLLTNKPVAFSPRGTLFQSSGSSCSSSSTRLVSWRCSQLLR